MEATPSTLSQGDDRIASIFNGIVAGAALAAWAELELLDDLADTGSLHLTAAARERHLDADAVRVLAKGLAEAGVVVYESALDMVKPGLNFASAYENRGYFLWLLGGYGEMLADLSVGLRETSDGNGKRQVNRDPRRIAAAGRLYGRQFVDPIVSPLFAEQQFRVLGDLGCGSGERLISAVLLSGARGIGIEIDGGVACAARDAVRVAGLDDRIQIVEADVADLRDREEFKEVDGLMSFFMGHDLWPRDKCITIFSRLRERFPAVRKFYLCDTFRIPDDQGGSPIFTLGFELTHALMGQYLPLVEEWEPVLVESGWRIARQIPVDIPSSAVLELEISEPA